MGAGKDIEKTWEVLERQHTGRDGPRDILLPASLLPCFEGAGLPSHLHPH